MSDDEQVPGEIVPDEESDAVIEPTPEFGEQDESAQEDEWKEDALEGGA